MIPTTLTHHQPIIFKELAKQIPINQFGLPCYLLDITKLFPIDNDPTIIKDYNYYANLANTNIAEAVIELNFSEGYPIIDATGSPIWEPYGIELSSAYLGTQLTKYIKMPSAAAAAEVAEELHAHAYMRSLRFITSTQQELQDLHTHATVYHWATRARAYDMYYLAADAKRREYLQRKQEHTQYDSAKFILEQAEALLHRMLAEPELWEVKPSDVIRLYGIATKLQRSAIGLSDKPTELTSTQSHTTLLEQIAQQSSQTTEQQSPDDALSNATIEQLEAIFFAKEDK